MRTSGPEVVTLRWRLHFYSGSTRRGLSGSGPAIYIAACLHGILSGKHPIGGPVHPGGLDLSPLPPVCVVYLHAGTRGSSRCAPVRCRLPGGLFPCRPAGALSLLGSSLKAGWCRRLVSPPRECLPKRLHRAPSPEGEGPPGHTCGWDGDSRGVSPYT